MAGTFPFWTSRCVTNLEELLDQAESSHLPFVGPAQSRPPSALDNPISHLHASWLAERHDSIQEVHPLRLHCFRDAVVGGLAYFEVNAKILSDSEFMPEHLRTGALDPNATLPSRLALDEKYIEDPCLLFALKGYDIYGHWLLDILPRVVLAKCLIGDLWSKIKVILPSDTPSFAKDILTKFFGLNYSNVIEFTRWETKLRLRQLLVPSLVHREYFFHPTALLIYEQMFAAANVDSTAPLPSSPLLFITRKGFLDKSRSFKRSFDNESEAFNRAERHGFITCSPEALCWPSQLKIFRQAKCIVGDYGSALHNGVFQQYPSRMLCFRPLNLVQSKIAALRGTSVNYMMPASEGKIDDRDHFSIDLEKFDRALEYELRRVHGTA
jgi:hypothetical protein